MIPKRWLSVGFMMVLFCGLFGWPRLRLDYDLEKGLYGEAGNASPFSGDDWLLVGIRQKDLGLRRKRLESKLDSLPYVRAQLSLAKLKLPILVGGQVQQRLALKQSQRLPSKALASHPLVNQRLFFEQDSSWFYLLQTELGLSREKHQRLFEALEALEKSYPGLRLSGKTVWQHYFIQEVQRDALQLSLVGLLLLLACCLYFVRPIKAIGHAALGIFAAFSGWLGLLALFGPDVHLLLGLAPVLMLTMGIGQCWHLFCKGMEQQKAATTGLWLSGLSSSMALLALGLSPVPMVSSFGIWSGLGLALQTFCLYVWVWPAVNRSPLKWRRKPPHIKSIGWWPLPFLLLLSTGLVLLIPDFAWHKELPQQHRAMKDAQWFENRIGGTIPYLFETPAPRKSCLQAKGCLDSLRQFETTLRKHYGMGPVWSPLTAWRLAGETFGKIPWGSQDLVPLLGSKQALAHDLCTQMDLFPDLALCSEKKWVWIAPGPLRSPSEMAALKNSVLPFPQGLLFDAPKQSADILKGLALSMPISLGTLLLMFLGVFGVKIGLIGWLSNVFPPLALAGLAGWLGLPLGLALTLALVVISGLAADDTFHYLVRYRHWNQKGNPRSSWKRALVDQNQAMYLSSMCLALGLLPLAWSNLETSRQLCLLMWAGIGLAWLTDQWVLPKVLKSKGSST